MKTYAEAKGEAPFDWNKFLVKNRFTDGDWNSAFRLSASYVTCACGNQCEIIPRDNAGVPDDPELKELGMLFFDAITQENPKWAKEVLEKIEKRSAELIKLISA